MSGEHTHTHRDHFQRGWLLQKIHTHTGTRNTPSRESDFIKFGIEWCPHPLRRTRGACRMAPARDTARIRFAPACHKTGHSVAPRCNGGGVVVNRQRARERSVSLATMTAATAAAASASSSVHSTHTCTLCTSERIPGVSLRVYNIKHSKVPCLFDVRHRTNHTARTQLVMLGAGTPSTPTHTATTHTHR